ncbi:MAG: GNAT family N-acetyltransferase, partial [Thermosynechococcaceae cyanobacterium]
TYVVTDGLTQVVAYYCLAAGSVDRATTPGSVSRNAPNPVPVIVLGRLAVDENHQGQGIGQSLIKQACLRTLSVSEEIGVRALLVHAKNENVATYYREKANLIPSKDNPLVLFLSTSQILNAL